MPLPTAPQPAAPAGSQQDLQAQLALALAEAAYWQEQFEQLLLACAGKTEALDAIISRAQAEPVPVLQ